MRRSLAAIRTTGILVVTVLCSACVVSTSRTGYARKPGTSKFLELIVAGACNTGSVPHVAVSALCADGTEVNLGSTDAMGNIRIPKETLHACSAKVVLLRAEHFFGGAIRADDPGFDLFAYDELFVELAPFAIL